MSVVDIRAVEVFGGKFWNNVGVKIAYAFSTDQTIVMIEVCAMN